MTDKTPINKEAEAAVLGSVLIDPVGVLHDLDGLLTPDDFYYAAHRTIYAAMQDLCRAGSAVDFVTLTARLSEAGQMQEVGGLAYLTHLLNAVPTAVHAPHYAGVVRSTADRRRIIAIASRLAQMAYSGEPELAVTDGITALSDLARASSDDRFMAWGDTFDAWNEAQLVRAAEYAAGAPQLRMPWRALSFVRPLRGGTLAAITAPPAVGKTAFAENLAEYWARRGFKILYFHLELSHQVMLDRRMARWSREPMEIIERGELTANMQRAENQFKTWPGAIHYQESSGWTASRIVAEAERRRNAGQCDVVIVDYLNKAALEIAAGMNVTTARGLAVEALKTWAERAGVPVVMLAQLSKEGKRAERKTGGDIRDTGEVEDKSNLIITLDREILNAPVQFGQRMIPAGVRSPITRVRVDKQTLGETGELELIFDAPTFTFHDVERERL